MEQLTEPSLKKKTPEDLYFSKKNNKKNKQNKNLVEQIFEDNQLNERMPERIVSSAATLSVAVCCLCSHCISGSRSVWSKQSESTSK